MTDAFDRLKAAIADRYTIEREIGSGGMATVYLAEDLKHKRKVAVKVLRPELAAALGPERFLKEIEIAAGLTHPHILPLHDSGEAEGFLYYVMPYIDGESLRDRLAKEGELPIAEAVRILRDVVEALSHAHKQHVVHRDIKPDNIMLSDRHALVTDFGIAKAVSEATGRQDLTTAGVAMGTPSYMAPEQAAADPNIDHRADIYAIGTVAYELLTGRPPFIANTQQEVLAAHITQIPDPVTRYRDSVPPSLEQLVMTCLAKKPADRWQIAEELRLQLEALATPSGGVPPTASQPVVPKRPTPRWRLPVALAAVAAVVAAGYFVLRFVQVGGPGTLIGDDVLDEHDRILVVEFRNHTNDSALAATVTDAIRTDLQQSAVVEVLSQKAMFDGISRMGLNPGTELSDSLTRDLTQRSNAKAYVDGDVRPIGAGYQITARVVGAVDGYEALSKRVTAEDNWQLIAALDDLGNQLRQGIGESLQELRAAPKLAQVTTSSLPALRAFTAAGRAFSEGHQRQAMPLLEQAVELDTAFATAWRFLGSVYYNLGMSNESRDAHRRSRLFPDRISERLRLEFVVSDYLWARDYAQAEAAFQRLQEIAPGAFMTHWANHMLTRRRWAEAESMSLRSIRIHDPPSSVDYANAVIAQVSLGRFDAADSLLIDMARKLPGHPGIFRNRSWVLWAQRDFAAVETFLDSVEANDASPPDLTSWRCILARARGKVAESRQCGIVHYQSALWELRYVGDTARANLQLDSLLARESPFYPGIVAVLAEMGDLAEVHRTLKRWRESAGSDDAVYRTESGRAAGLIALMEGRPDSAVNAFLNWHNAGFYGGTHVFNRGLAEAANAHDRAGRPDSAIALYERALGLPTAHAYSYETIWYPHALRRLGELHESLDHREQAVEYYNKFIDLWNDADEILQPQVDGVREAVARLTGETVSR